MRRLEGVMEPGGLGRPAHTRCLSRFASRSTRRGGTLGLALTLALALAGPGPSHAELGEGELPDWIPSIGAGAGIQARRINSSFDALLKSDAFSDAEANLFNCRPQVTIFGGANLYRGFCDFTQDQTETVDGGAIPVSAQVLGPAWEILPGGGIRPFVSGGYTFTFDRRNLARQGFLPIDFERGNAVEADLRVQSEAEPTGFWWLGGGAAFQLPFERPTFFKIGGLYHEQEYDLQASFFRQRQIGVTPPPENEPIFEIFGETRSTDLTVRGAGLSAGLESEVARAGPLAFNLSLEALVTFPFSGTSAGVVLPQDQPLLSQQEVDPQQFGPPGIPFPTPVQIPFCGPDDDPTPGIDPIPCYEDVPLDFDADEVFYFGFIMVRVLWIGW